MNMLDSNHKAAQRIWEDSVKAEIISLASRRYSSEMAPGTTFEVFITQVTKNMTGLTTAEVMQITTYTAEVAACIFDASNKTWTKVASVQDKLEVPVALEGLLRMMREKLHASNSKI